MMITNEHLKMWGITREEIRQAAGQNTPRLLPAELQDIQNVVMELIPDCRGESCFAGYMYVLTNMQRSHGAAAILYPGLLEMIGEEWKENLDTFRGREEKHFDNSEKLCKARHTRGGI